MNEWIKNYEHCLFTEQNVQEILHFYYTLSGLLYFVRISFHGKKWNFIVSMSGNVIFYLIRIMVAFRDNNFSVNAIIPSRA